MYKVFINDKPLILTRMGQEMGKWADLSKVEYEGIEQLLQLKSSLMNQPGEQGFLVLCAHPDQAWESWVAHHHLVTAAGGLVTNEKGETLMIYRHDRWDLPKGKMEPGEDVESNALREVEEECAIGQLSIQRKLMTTYHTYTMKGKEILKATHWFAMQAPGNQTPSPQLEESITRAEWMNAQAVNLALENTYETIREVVAAN